MKTTARFILSATTALGLIAFTTITAFTAGIMAPVTQLAFGLLVIYGLLEIAVLSYTPRPVVNVRIAPRLMPTRAVVPARSRVPAVIEYSSGDRKAA